MSVPNFMLIHPIVVEVFLPKSKEKKRALTQNDEKENAGIYCRINWHTSIAQWHTIPYALLSVKGSQDCQPLQL